MRIIPQNAGKLFENDIKASTPDSCWIYRLRDNASSFAGGENTRFTSSNICDFILYEDITRLLVLIECKSTKGTSVNINMIRQNQIDGLLDASKHQLIAGILVNFRNTNNDTFFITIKDFVDMMSKINKKSFNIKDLENNNAIRVENTKKRTRYTYNIPKLLGEVNYRGE